MRAVALVVLVGLAWVLVSCGEKEADSATTLPTRDITVKSADGSRSETLTVELATTDQERQQGLMYRQQMEEDRGMLFLFPGERQSGGFWMKNTYIPLTIAYLAEDGRVLALRDGKPLDETILYPGTPYSAVLEVNQGWFDRHGMGLGAVVELPTDGPAPQ